MKTTLKIGVNLRLLNLGKIGGMEGYVRNLLEYLLKLDPTLSLVLFVTDTNSHIFNFDPQRVKKVEISHSDYGEKIISSLINEVVTLYFCPLLILEPIVVSIPTVINIPDLQHEVFPEFFTQEVLDWRKLHFQASAASANAVLTLSEFSAKSIIDKLGCAPEKVKAIHIAGEEGSSASLNPEMGNQVEAKFSLPGIFGYFPANTWPHKNHKNLLQAIKIYKEKFGPAPKIILTGAADSGHLELQGLVKELGLENEISFLGYLSREEMHGLFRKASFLIFPSLFEGFGMPPIEAMLFGCPVICSNTTSLPEIVGDAGLFFDPRKPEEIADAIHRVLHEPGLRHDLIEKGTLQAAKFNWTNTAEQTLAVFSEVVEKHQEKDKDGPLVSIVTPSYNQGEFIEETILSVIGQRYANMEYLVMDGGSTDQTVSILQKYDDRIEWISETDKGQGDAVNKGFRQAKGEILGWLNSDDTYLPDTVIKVVRYFQENPEAVMVYGNAYYTNKDGIIESPYLSEDFNLERLAEKCIICQPSVFIRRKVFAEIGELDIDLRTCMDYEYWIRIGKRYPKQIGFLGDFLATSRMYEENKTFSMREKVYEEIIKTVRKYYGHVPDSWFQGYLHDVFFGQKVEPKPAGLGRWCYWIGISRRIRALGLPKPMLMATIATAKAKIWSDIQIVEGQYEDGWVGKECVFRIWKKPSQKAIRICGKNMAPDQEPLEIGIFFGGEKVSNISVTAKGSFMTSIPLPLNLQNAGMLELKLIPENNFCPKDFGSADERLLSFILLDIKLLKKDT
jgi:glycosyltransferase involved in cell wall biosynthesis